MNRLLQHRYVLRQNLIFLIGICLCFYFTYHMLQGERSYITLMSLNADIKILTKEQIEVQNEREILEQKVVMMRPGTINKDLLEERARAVLGFRYPGEISIVTN